MEWITTYDMHDPASRCRVSRIAAHHANLIEEGEPFSDGPMDEHTLHSLSCIMAELVDIETLVRDIKTGTAQEGSDIVAIFVTIAWAAGFKTGAQMYGTWNVTQEEGTST